MWRRSLFWSCKVIQMCLSSPQQHFSSLALLKQGCCCGEWSEFVPWSSVVGWIRTVGQKHRKLSVCSGRATNLSRTQSFVGSRRKSTDTMECISACQYVHLHAVQHLHIYFQALFLGYSVCNISGLWISSRGWVAGPSTPEVMVQVCRTVPASAKI